MKKYSPGWMDGWVDGWMDVKAVLRIAYSNQKLSAVSLKLFPDFFLLWKKRLYVNLY